MISRDELVEWARENGYPETTSTQIERWHKKGLIPPPQPVPTGGKPGSAYAYPDVAKKNLLLVLQSKSRKLDERLLEVWYGGGTISAEHLKSLLMRILRPIQRIVRGMDKVLDGLGQAIVKPLVAGKSVEDSVATANLMLNVLSPRKDDVIWGYDSPGERSVAEIAADVFGVEQLRELAQDTTNQSADELWDEFKNRMNIKELVKVVETATDADFEGILPLVRIMDVWLADVAEVALVWNKRISAFDFFRSMPRNLRIAVFTIVALVFCKSDETRKLINDAVAEWEITLPKIHVMAEYVRWMKSHPKLKRRRNWVRHFGEFSDEALEQVREQHEAYIRSHPEFMEIIAEYQEEPHA